MVLYHIVGIFRDVIFTFCNVEWDPWKINPCQFVTRINGRVAL